MSYDYNKLCTDFLDQSQYSGKTAQNRMSYTATNLYSYSSLLAKLTEVDNQSILLVNSLIASYSQTSIRHYQTLLECTPKHIEVLLVSDINHMPSSLQTIWDYINTLLKQHSRARTQQENYRAVILEQYALANRIIELYKIDKRTKVFKQSKQVLQTLMRNGILYNT